MLIESGHQLNKGRLAGTVLAEQRVNLSWTHIEIDVVRRLNAGESLADATNRENRRGLC
jgi:hypothetical protein